MGNDRLRIADAVEAEWQTLSDDERKTIRAALLVIDDDPIAGTPLFDPLKGYWSYREGHLRIIYRIVPQARFVVILTIHRALSQ